MKLTPETVAEAMTMPLIDPALLARQQEQDDTLRKAAANSKTLRRVLKKAVHRSRRSGVEPVTTEKGDQKRALMAKVAAVTGEGRYARDWGATRKWLRRNIPK